MKKFLLLFTTLLLSICGIAQVAYVSIPVGHVSGNHERGNFNSTYASYQHYFTDPLPGNSIITSIEVNYVARDQGWGNSGFSDSHSIDGTTIGGAPLRYNDANLYYNYIGSIPGYSYGGNNLFQVDFQTYPGFEEFFGGATLTIHYAYCGVTMSGPGNYSVNADPGGCGAVVNYSIPTATDPCSTVNVYQVEGYPSGSGFPVGTTLVTYRGVDNRNNDNYYSFSVTVNDRQAPVITTDGNKSVNNDPGVCGASVTLRPTATDNCSVGGPLGTRSDGRAINALFPVGTTIVTWNVTDGHGNAAIPVTQTVTVSDKENPKFTNPVPITLASCLATLPDLTYNGNPTDNCSGLVVTQSPAIGSPIAPGQTIAVTLTARDASNNQSTTTFNVTRPDITPVAVNDAATVCGGSSVNINVLSNDSHPQNAPLTVSDNTTPSVGTLVKNADNTFTYTAPANYSGPVTFTYTIKANDGVIPFSGNNHYYEYIASNGITWVNANAAASAKTYNGLKGYLVTVTSQEEQNFVNAKLAGTGWMGASDLAHEGVWRWVTGPEGLENGGLGRIFSDQRKLNNGNCSANTGQGVGGNYVNWQPGEPNDCGANLNQYIATDPNRPGEHYAHFYAGSGTWNDFPNNAGVQGYLVEYGGLESCTPVLTATATVTITVHGLPVAITSHTPVSCAGGSDGSITVNASNGDVPYQYSKDGGATYQNSNVFTGLTDGNYSIVVKSATGCADAPQTVRVTTTLDVTPPVISNMPANIVAYTDNLNCNTLVGFPRPTATDNCGIRSFISNNSFYNLYGFAQFSKGVNVITFTATDLQGNQSSASFTITVVDNQVPIITGKPADITKNVAAGTCGQQIFWNPPTASDNCPGVALSGDHVPGDVFPVGTTLVTYTATDAFGLTTSISFNVTVVDNEKPTITAPSNVSVNTDPGQCSAVVSLGTPVAADNCGVKSITNNAPVQFPVGVTTVTYTVTDVNNNTNTATQTVTVIDNEKPSVIQPSPITVGTDVGKCGATVSISAPSASDNCGIASVSSDAPAFFPSGNTTITWTIKDVHGNVTTVTQLVTVNDTEKPVITSCVPAQTINLDGNCNASLPDYRSLLAATDNCTSSANLVVTQSPAAGTVVNSVGTINVTFTVTDAAGNSSNCSMILTKKDVTPPTISPVTNINVNNDNNVCGAVVNYNLPTVTDNCSGTAAVGVHVLNPGALFFDYANNTYKNQYSPGLPITFTPTDGQYMAVLLQTGGATHYLYQDITLSNGANQLGFDLQYNNHAGGFNPGSQMISIEVRDVNTNAVLKTLFQTNPGDPIVLPMTHFNYDLSQFAGKTVRLEMVNATVYNFYFDVLLDNVTLPGSTLANGSFETGDYQSWNVYTSNSYSGTWGIGSGPGVTLKQTAGLPSGSTFPVGTTTNNFIATDVSGNSSTTSFTVTVNDTQKPNITAPAAIAVNNDAGKCGASVALGTPVTSDNCGVASVTNDAPAFFPVGTTTVTYIVTDIHNNTNTATQQVTVTDNEAPVISGTPTDVTVNTGAGRTTCDQTATWIPPTATDNCGAVTVTSTNNPGDVFPVGTTVVTYTFTDIHGNSSSTSFNVIVVDNTPPVIAGLLGNQNFQTGIGRATCDQVGSWTPPTATDNCGAVTVSSTSNPGDVFAVGTTPVTYTFTDIHGNSSSTTFNVVVTDNTPPVISGTPTEVTVNTGAGRTTCDQTATWIPPTATDNCAVATVVSNHNPGDVFNVGTTNVTYTFTDIHGNSSSTSFNVIVTDNTVPTIATTAVAVNNDPGVCAAMVTLKAPVTFDNCGVSTVTNDHASTLFPVGITVVNWTVTDIHGNSSATTQTIVVTDNEKPIITVPANQTFCANYGGVTTYTIPQESATDNCGVLSTTYAVTGATTRSGTGSNASGIFNVGTSTITWTVTDIHSNVQTASITVTVNPLPVASYVTTNKDAFCNKLNLTASSTQPNSTYSWLAPGGASASAVSLLQLGNANADGVYTLYATAKGCRSEFPVTYTYAKQNMINNYTILGFKEVDLGLNNNVQTGSVGVTAVKGEAEMRSGVSIASPGAFLKAARIDIDGTVNIPIKVMSPANPLLPTMIYNTTSTRGLPYYQARTATTGTVNGNYSYVYIVAGSNITLTGTIFGSITVEKGANVTFSSPVVNIGSLAVGGGKGDDHGNGDDKKTVTTTTYSNVHFATNANVLVSSSVYFGLNTIVNAENRKVTFYVGHLRTDGHHENDEGGHEGDYNDNDETSFTVVGGDTKVTANVYAPNGRLQVSGVNGDDNNWNWGHGGDDDHHAPVTPTSVTYMTGLFIANQVESDSRGVIWNSYDCGLPQGITGLNGAMQYVETEVKKADQELTVKASPNPTTNFFMLNITSNDQKTEAVVRVVDGLGRPLNEFNHVVIGSTVTFGQAYAAGYYFAEVTQGNQHKVVKLIKGL